MSIDKANMRQHGGAHYMLKEYQHWDWACDINLHYLHACATKYPSRWKDKGGVEDLKKAIHYIDKAVERGIAAAGLHYDARSITTGIEKRVIEATSRYVAQFPEHEAEAIMAIVMGEWDTARSHLQFLIDEENIAPIA